MSGCIFGVGTLGQLGKKPHPVLESTYRIGVGLDTSLIPIHAISCLYTDSFGGILMYSRYPTKLRWWLIHIGMSLWHVACLNTYLDLVSYLQDTKIRFNCKSNLTSAIGNFSESQHLASYVSRHNAMAYDILLDQFLFLLRMVWSNYCVNCSENEIKRIAGIAVLWSGGIPI